MLVTADCSERRSDRLAIATPMGLENSYLTTPCRLISANRYNPITLTQIYGVFIDIT